jgi:hypothetical protein
MCGINANQTAGHEMQMTPDMASMPTFGYNGPSKIPALEKRQGRGTPSAKS